MKSFILVHVERKQFAFLVTRIVIIRVYHSIRKKHQKGCTSNMNAGIPILVSATVRPGEQWEVAGELRRRAMDALRLAGIDLAAGRTVLVSRSAPPDVDPAVDVEGDAEYT